MIILGLQQIKQIARIGDEIFNRNMITPTDKLEVINGCLHVNDREFVVEYPDEPLITVNEYGTLVTRGRDGNWNEHRPHEIKGYYA